ncbi:MAG: ThiF family adenylyltransferase [Sedimentisphaerales bacterium]|nr:ThiF family adenylyltransferase [Sedimentisphaerales bacterium]
MSEQQNRFLRQLDILPPEKLSFPIVVIGAGAIGSATVVNLAKMGCGQIMVWDHDNLEEHNIPNQLCKPDCVGRPKVNALAELADELTGTVITIDPRKYMGQALEGVVIVTVDNMMCRQMIWKRAKMNAKVPLLIDARMGAEFARVYTIHPTNPDEGEFYSENLYSNDEVERLPCSARSIIYCPTVIAGLIALQVKKYATNDPLHKEILFDLPNLVLSV